jgi:pantoate--beta-alanine ligase
MEIYNKRSIKIARSIEELREIRKQLSSPLGFVPTMGYLHEGHLSLVRQARFDCASVAVSIFVNPTQFGPHEDLETYPRDTPKDVKMLESEGVNLVWLPDDEIIYPPDFQTWVNVEKVSLPLEGAMRPGHFKGVATIVAKLFNCVQPDRAYFGQKDAQQTLVVRRMTQDLNFPIEIIVCPTIREPDGLAMSSRNEYLTPVERESATVLYRSLCAAKQAFEKSEREAAELRKIMSEVINRDPLANLQYISCADPESLEELHGTVNHALLSLAVYIGKTRLIDNMIIGNQER